MLCNFLFLDPIPKIQWSEFIRSSFHDLIIPRKGIRSSIHWASNSCLFWFDFRRFQTFETSELFHCAWKADLVLGFISWKVLHLSSSGILKIEKVRKKGKTMVSMFWNLGFVKIDGMITSSNPIQFYSHQKFNAPTLESFLLPGGPGRGFYFLSSHSFKSLLSWPSPASR